MLRRARFVVLEGSASDARAVAGLHAAAFARGWSTAEVSALLEHGGTRLHVARTVARPEAAPLGFILTRQAGDEAEVLTIATAPRARGRGVGRAMMDAAIAALQSDRVDALILEVDSGNTPALALYRLVGRAASPFLPSYHARRARRGKEDPKRRGERFGRASSPRNDGPLA